MPGQNMMEVGESVHRIIDIQHRAAGIAEYTFHTLENQAAEENFRAGNNFRLPHLFHDFFLGLKNFALHNHHVFLPS